ncbi:1-pyrroline-5-carboxylate dehydrogenase [Burkholderia contaminans FFH2055]|uniref:MarR family transcriptional regulator n=1 Tax=Burkholderia contaminans TaxID=488447 RepID=UPI000625529E|nr:MarR family transcriptional regulator [Burkholderia contaminans]KKL38582.1 1-pyrroline-5-carboxylate dehydrogenase [Burkholderia contaminans FFH2055]MEB4631123.1 MarR family transcriptional regulator [Burkholderia contaminans]MEB4638029.1 MarR family transcriptional regulator [Burkholderia contaminans]MEB4653113.1 MarR family transcriptional regulator [Burkholderia contaminans]MEB4658149.1 MarR family transcriptional regulator [Burkholderia contaminans]
MTEEIERFLGNATEATAKAIAAGLGMPHFDVLKAINKMHGSGLVEREKRAGGGNEYVYWLARGTRPAVTVSNAPAATPEQLVAEANDSMPAEAFSAAMNERVIADLRAEVERLTDERDAAQFKAETWRANAAKLEARIDELTLGPVGARAPLFVTVGRYCKPKRHASLEKAQRRGSALVRSEKESEVLVLEPVGRIVRGTEWRPK